MIDRRSDSTDPEGLDAAWPEAPKPDDEWLKRHVAALVESLPLLAWVSADGGRWTWSSPNWSSYTGLSAPASQDFGWYAAVHPDDHALTRAAWQAAPAHGVLDVEHRLLDRDGGEARWFRTRGTPLPTAPGQPREWMGTCTDVHQTRWLEERERLLVAELRHRVRDSLALTRLITRRTAKTSATADEFVSHLEGRLDAIARVQLFAADDPGAGVDLERLVAEEAVAHAAPPGERVRISGPAVLLSAKAAGLFGLALHELMANAVKYGVLSAFEGYVDVTWRVEAGRVEAGHAEAGHAEAGHAEAGYAEGARPGGVLRFEWHETGVPPGDATAPHQGFGTELIERTLPRELGGSASLRIGPDGVRCTILLPLTAGIAVPGIPSHG